MTTSITTDSSAYSATTIPSGWDEIPCVQYGFPKEIGPFRSPKLKTIFDPVPDGANTASPVYLLPKEQYERQRDRENPYRVGDGYTMKATELQDECEADDRVLYPIHIESDAYHKEGPSTLIEWFREFVEDVLDVPFHTCALYFSGNRSIHVHVPRFVSGENQREQLKGQAETFCKEAGAELDCDLYSSKRLSRIPGVEHEKKGLRKVEIEPEWNHTRIVREAATSTAGIPKSYEAILRQVFFQPSLVKNTVQPTNYTPHALFRTLDSDKTVLKFESDKRDIETPLIERKSLLDGTTLSEKQRWWMYNDKEFSPYALAHGGGRSVAAVKVKGGAFAREDKTTGNSSHPIHALVPVYFYSAQGCAGDEFTKTAVHAPLQLSKRDYSKWDCEDGDHVVIIGGQSRSSRILRVQSWEATAVGYALTKEGGSREAALDFLSDQGYDVGVSGSKGSTASTGWTPSGKAREIFPARQSPQSSAEELQRKAEQEGIDTLSFPEVAQVAHRHLLQGWKPTWEWFEEQYGPQFDPVETWNNLRSIVEADGYEEYDHIEVPEKPV